MPPMDHRYDRSAHPARTVRDVEGVVTVRDGALRIAPLARPGWGRAGVHLDAVPAADGLVLAVGLLNGHNGSAPFRQRDLLRQVRRWVLGSGIDPLATRLRRWPSRPVRESVLRRLACWTRALLPGPDADALGGNAAVGWYPEPMPDDPTRCGHGFVIRGAEARNGTLLARVDGRLLPVAEDLPNIPLLLVVALRPEGAVYLMADAEDPGWLRPLAVDPAVTTGPQVPAFQQSVLGQIGFSTDTVLYGMTVARCPGLPPGVTPTEPCGLISAELEVLRAGAVASLVWRSLDAGNHVRLDLRPEGLRLHVRNGGTDRLAASVPNALTPGRHSVQLRDDGRRIAVAVDGQRLDGLSIDDPVHAGGGCLGYPDAAAAGMAVRRFTAYPRRIPVPAALAVPLPWVPQGSVSLVAERFAGPCADLDGQPLAGGGAWRRLVGEGGIGSDGSGAIVQAGPDRPAPGRTLYGIDWPDPDFADLEAVIVPPPLTGRGGANSRAGVVFWQDPANHVVCNLWLNGGDRSMPETYGSVSCFFYRNGFEDVYDAVWTNVGGRLRHGEPATLRVACDGRRFTAWLDGRAVLHRAFGDVYADFPSLAIRRVGIGVNWEWGTDTGSRFRSFTARRR
ncbi:hypothetical protein HL658_27225 [Azospirillum sp. RWY-5-1]|uniref:Concanavalin A-like lectin/glucanase superfamily protein n=1 Tax=Azospirillum oleiclasticum TaxID=2735135 RepID=A0ABX2TKP4_9PROT|nr:hypothetical protein [Azospirillum oleiclasticum]NYZ16250.1 hypothetical protein [Azospirillum oleiclasticum]NYZ23737.1 hypothetical protein [Azospirillum oleiclasticum]